MEKEKLLGLLKQTQIPNTELVKAATTELRTTYYQQAETLQWLLEILATNDAPEIRQSAAVEAHRLVPKHWTSLPGQQKQTIRHGILQTTTNEPAKLVRHASARLMAAMATLDLNDGEWLDLPGILFQASTSPKVEHRDVGTYVIYTLLEAMGDHLQDKIPELFQLYDKTIQDPESADVRMNTMLGLGKVAMLIEPDESPRNLKLFVNAFPSMVIALKATIEEKDEDRIMSIFEVFQTLLGCESALLSQHFKDLLDFMIQVATDTNNEDDTRSQALSFLMQCARYRKMKIQAIKDMGEKLTLASLQIATEIDEDDDDDEDDSVSPPRAALGLLDLLASSLPPRMVIVPLMKALPQYVNNDNRSYRQAGILALAFCVEGAPDFVSTQLNAVMPVVMKLLNDPITSVRHAALQGVARLADDLAGDLCEYHEQLVPVLIKNLDHAVQGATEAERKKNIGILKGSCGALDSVAEGLDEDVMATYLSELVPRLGHLLSHEDINVKAAAAGAIGAAASSAEGKFQPYFEDTMKAFWQFTSIKDGDTELDLRATVCDAMGRIAMAVGPDAFQQYLQPLMQVSEEGLNLGHPRVRETSYILWSTLAKVYGNDFKPYLDGVVKGLLECLNQEESQTEVELGAHAEDLVGQEIKIAGKTIKVAAATDDPADLDGMDDDEDDDDWDDLVTTTAIALEKEIAVEVIADVFTHTRENFATYFQKMVEVVLVLVQHNYEGVRKMALATLWRAYACLWGLLQQHTGQKWEPGLPSNITPTPELAELGRLVTEATMAVWEDDVDRSVVTDINRNVAATLKECGPAILAQPKFAEQTLGTLGCLVTRSHPCQQDLGDEEDVQDEESSEYDWLVIDTAIDVIVGISAALGAQFVEAWRVLQKPLLKFASSQITYERSTVMGAIAECSQNMGSAVSPFTDSLLKILVHRLSDEDPETKSNAAFGVGQLIYHSENSKVYLASYNTILSKLEGLLQTDGSRIRDNAAGCVCRMTMAHPDKVPLGDILPVLVNLLPLEEDFEENKPVYECICMLYEHNNPTIFELTPKLLPVFAKVLGEPQDQLDDETRARIVKTLQFIHSKDTHLVQSNQELMKILQG